MQTSLVRSRAQTLAAPQQALRHSDRAHLAILQVTAIMFLFLLLSTAPIAAQRPGSSPAERAPSLQLFPYAGYLVSGDFLSGPLGTSIGPAPAPIFGAQLGLPLGLGFALVGNGAFSQGDIEAGVPILGGLGFGQSTTWLYDGGLELSVPLRAPTRLFLQGGVGGVHRELTVRGVSTSANDLMLVAGAGLDLPIASGAGLRLMARDYVGKFDFEEAVLFDVDGKTMHNIALSAGLRLSF
jgi:hypothetical protein